MMNRLELANTKNFIIKNKKYSNQPVLLIIDHASGYGTSIHLSTWAHFWKTFGLLSTTVEFNNPNPFAAMIPHFFEMIPIYGTGKDIIMKMVKRLMRGDCVLIAPEGAPPYGKYTNTGFIQEMFTGPARVAYTYWKLTGKKLIIQPVCSLGANNAFPPYPSKKKIKKTKIIVKFGKAYTLTFSEVPSREEIKEKTHQIAMSVAKIWGQKKLIPNYSMTRRKEFEKTGEHRVYKSYSRDEEN
ncbi:MAG: hypothetical protein ACFFAO_09220 [Candidatus Hermodarchaeota archaeon]